MEKAGGPEAMMKNGAKFLMMVAVTKIFSAVSAVDSKEGTNQEVSLPKQAEEKNDQNILDPCLEKKWFFECAELREANEEATEMSSQLQVRVVACLNRA